MRPWLITTAVCGAVLIGGVAFHKGRQFGTAACEARHAAASEALQKELFAAADTMSEQAAELEAYRTAQASKIEEYENAATADPGACRLSIDARVRLKNRWSTD